MSYSRSRRTDFTRRCELHNDVTTAIILGAFLHGGRTIVAATRYNRDYDCSDSLDAPGQPPRPAHPGSLSPRRHCRCPLARLRGRHPAGHPTLSARHRTPSPHHRTPSPHHRTPSPHHRNALPSPPQRPRFHHRPLLQLPRAWPTRAAQRRRPLVSRGLTGRRGRYIVGP